ncbi:MAG: prepilin-type N-terminal cleavage/methylation domain-containing protein [Planctomycetota bacterium]
MKRGNEIRWKGCAALTRFRGFTLIELITAITIFSVLGIMLLSMVKSGMSMWKKGESSRNTMEQGVQMLETLCDELRLAFTENEPLAGAPEARFVCDFYSWDRDGDGRKEAQTQRLKFTRISVEERENLNLRNAGDHADGYQYFTAWEEPKPADALPTGGLAESLFMAYAPLLAKGETSDGLLHLYRGYRTPVGGADSFFAPQSLSKPQQVEAALIPMLSGLLYLEFRFWNQDTRTFDAELIAPDVREGAGFTWDSTRGLLPDDLGAWPNNFRFGMGEESIDDSTDDLFPSKVLVTVVVEDSLSGDIVTTTTDAIAASDLLIPVDGVKRYKNPEGETRFAKIEEEWIEIRGSEGSELIATRRGVRNTIPSDHKAGSRVHSGRRFSAVVEIGTAKSCWNGNRDE